MGVFLDYAFHCECSEKELLGRLRRLHKRLKTLPFDSVSKILRVNPVYQIIVHGLLESEGHKLPPEVRKRVNRKMGTDHDDWCALAAPTIFRLVPKELQLRFYQPARDYIATTTLWKEEELPEKVSDPLGVLTYPRGAIAMEYASIMLRHGYAIAVQPCEGCETFAIGLTTFHSDSTPIWLGSGFTKTQYATRFVETHESLCTALDYAQEEGLLLKASDTCGYYESRDWSESAPQVNAETTLADALRSLFGLGIANARVLGIEIEDMSDPATKNFNLVDAEALGKSKKKEKKDPKKGKKKRE